MILPECLVKKVFNLSIECFKLTKIKNQTVKGFSTLYKRYHLPYYC